MDKARLIEVLELEPHMEGGFYRRTYCSEQLTTTTTGANRAILTSIYYMLTDDSPVGYFHRNQSDIVHYWHSGAALTYFLIDPSGHFSTLRLGPNLETGETLQITVPGGYWKATELQSGDYGLLSEAVAPGFDYADMSLASAEQLQQAFPQLITPTDFDIKKFCKS